MGGFVAPRKTYLLTFAEPEFADLEIRLSGMTLGELLSSMSIQERYQLFASRLLSWNLTEEDGTVLPATMDGLNTLDPGFVNKICGAWITAVNGVAVPLDSESTSGEDSPEASIPMAVSSPSQQS